MSGNIFSRIFEGQLRRNLKNRTNSNSYKTKACIQLVYNKHVNQYKDDISGNRPLIEKQQKIVLYKLFIFILFYLACVIMKAGPFLLFWRSLMRFLISNLHRKFLFMTFIILSIDLLHSMLYINQTNEKFE